MYTNASCKVQTSTGFNAFGEPQWGTPTAELCSIVRLQPKMSHTTVRADSSMSRGHGDEAVLGSCRLLLSPTTQARLGSLIELTAGLTTIRFKVTSMEPRMDALGPIDHYEVEGEQCP